MKQYKVLRAFRFEGKDTEAHKVGTVVELKEAKAEKLVEARFIEEIVVDKTAEVKDLQAELAKSYEANVKVCEDKDKEIAGLKAEIAKLQAELAKAKAKPTTTK